MNAIRSVFAALANLAAAIESLASVIDSTATRLSRQIADGDAPPQLPPTAEVIDNEPAPAKRNGRAKASA